MTMLGMTKKQFLKRSKECLDAQGIHVLNISELIDLELSGKINERDSYERIRAIMKDIDSIFTCYERLNPPSDCYDTKSKILTSIILLQETAAAFYEYILKIIKYKTKDSSKLEKVYLLLNKFREAFKPLNNSFNTLL
ncbi:MAG: hypothetical protein NKF70_11250 [Methanobacterium sp. ERen5]|nr:MAG: hypothetical protein NKF70_11250 [Methanobacterium sp. ERen5]